MAQGRSVGSLFIDIEARTARLEADLAKTRGILQRMRTDVAIMSRGFSQAFGAMKAAVGAFVGVASFRALNNMVLSQYENVRAMIALSEQTQLTVDQVQAYTKASEVLNVTNLNLQTSMRGLLKTQSEAIRGNKQARETFDAMGMSMEFVRRAMPGDLFEASIDSLHRLGNQADRVELSNRLFGKSAMDLMPIINRGTRTITEARQALKDTNSEISLMDSAKVRVTLGAINDLQDRWQGFKQRLAVGLAPTFYHIANLFSALIQSINIDDLSQKISAFLVKAYVFLVTLPEHVSLGFNKVKLELLELIQMMSGTMGGKFGLMFRIPDMAPEIERTKQKLEELRGTVETLSTAVTGDFEDKVQEVLHTLNLVESTTSRQVSDATRIMVETFTSAFSQLSDVLAEFITTGEASFADFGRMVVKQMISMFIKLSLLNPLMNAVFGGMSGWSTLPTITPMAVGGTAVAGDMALVGEKGPELIKFNKSGTVMSNDRTTRELSQGGGTTLTINVPFTIMPGVSHAEFAAKLPEIINMCKGAVAEAVLRGGAYGKAMRA